MMEGGLVKTGRRKPNLRTQLWARMVTRTCSVHCTQAEPETQCDMLSSEMTNLQDKIARFRHVLDFARGRPGAGEHFPSGLGASTAYDGEVAELKNRLLQEMQCEDGLSEDTKEMLAKTQYGNMKWLWMCRCGGGLDPNEWMCASPLQLGIGPTTRTWWYHGDPRTSDCGRCLKNEKYYKRRSVLLWEGVCGGSESVYEHLAADRGCGASCSSTPHRREENRHLPDTRPPPTLMCDIFINYYIHLIYHISIHNVVFMHTYTLSDSSWFNYLAMCAMH